LPYYIIYTGFWGFGEQYECEPRYMQKPKTNVLLTVPDKASVDISNTLELVSDSQDSEVQSASQAKPASSLSVSETNAMSFEEIMDNEHEECPHKLQNLLK